MQYRKAKLETIMMEEATPVETYTRNCGRMLGIRCLKTSFAFLGLGLPSGTPEWGAMLNDARTALYSHPELLIYPGLCIFVTAAGFNLFGEALRDILTPEEDSL